MNIRNILHSGDVVRFHNHVGIDKQKTAEHQWGVALIVEHIYPEGSKTLLLAALTHDAAEYYIGDIPAPVKWDNPELKKTLHEMERRWEEQNGVHFDLAPEEQMVLKMADTLEGMWFCVHQVRMGNINAKRPFRKWREFFQDSFTVVCSNHFTKAGELFHALVQEMEEL
jgi:5'-deoxynucleotidase YfbR-like HD superfamily hydrolase